jgi:hypothetical protein
MGASLRQRPVLKGKDAERFLKIEAANLAKLVKNAEARILRIKK